MKRQLLREWIAARGRVSPAQLQDDTPLLKTRIVRSHDLVELILFLEELGGRPLDAARLEPGGFRDIDTICRLFLEER